MGNRASATPPTGNESAEEPGSPGRPASSRAPGSPPSQERRRTPSLGWRRRLGSGGPSGSGSSGAQTAGGAQEVTATGAQDEDDEATDIDDDDDDEGSKRLSYWGMVKGGYNELVNAIIRPPRAEYDDKVLGPPSFTVEGKLFVRDDLTLVNRAGLKLQCSHWRPAEAADVARLTAAAATASAAAAAVAAAAAEAESGVSAAAVKPRASQRRREAARATATELQAAAQRAARAAETAAELARTAARAPPLPCVVYLHGNASCRAEALEILPLVLSCGVSLFAPDLSGSGKSEGEYISLGWHEREDVETVVGHLRGCGRVSTLGLWGRSMGAVTALMFADRDPTLACLVLDSPFASLKQLARELVDSAQLAVPRFAVGVALKMVRSSVKHRAGFDINKLNPIKNAGNCFIPALFGAAEGDEFIRPHHSKQIHDAYAGDKNIILFEGDHNSQRPHFFHASVAIWMHNTLVAPTLAAGGAGPDHWVSRGSQSPEDAAILELLAAASVGNAGEGTYRMPAPLAAGAVANPRQAAGSVPTGPAVFETERPRPVSRTAGEAIAAQLAAAQAERDEEEMEDEEEGEQDGEQEDGQDQEERYEHLLRQEQHRELVQGDGTLGVGEQDDYYEQAMMRHAIELSLAESARSAPPVLADLATSALAETVALQAVAQHQMPQSPTAGQVIAAQVAASKGTSGRDAGVDSTLAAHGPTGLTAGEVIAAQMAAAAAAAAQRGERPTSWSAWSATHSGLDRSEDHDRPRARTAGEIIAMQVASAANTESATHSDDDDGDDDDDVPVANKNVEEVYDDDDGQAFNGDDDGAAAALASPVENNENNSDDKSSSGEEEEDDDEEEEDVGHTEPATLTLPPPAIANKLHPAPPPVPSRASIGGGASASAGPSSHPLPPAVPSRNPPHDAPIAAAPNVVGAPVGGLPPLAPRPVANGSTSPSSGNSPVGRTRPPAPPPPPKTRPQPSPSSSSENS
jgi:hypothetical protein